MSRACRPAYLNGAAKDVVVIDTGNYYPQQRDGQIKPIEDGMTESRWVEQQLGSGGEVFNNIYADHLLKRGRPAGTAGRIALPIAGDDKAAKAVVVRLLDQLGFDAVDAGGLDESWRQQPGTPVYGTDLDAGGVRRALSQASRERTAQWRAAPSSTARGRHCPLGFRPHHAPSSDPPRSQVVVLASPDGGAGRCNQRDPLCDTFVG